MKNSIFFSIVIVVLSSVAGICETMPMAANITNLPGVLWNRTLGEQNVYYMKNTITISPTAKELVVGGITSIVPQVKGESPRDEVWIWKVNEIGDLTSKISIKSLVIGKQTYILSQVSDLIVNPDNTIVLTGVATNMATLLLKINSNGEILFFKVFSSSYNINKIISLVDNSYILIGHKNAIPAIVKVNTSGNEVWIKYSDKGKFGYFSGGFATKDGGFVLIENSGASSKIVHGDSQSIFVAKYNAAGEKQNENFIAGNWAKIAKGKDENFAVIYKTTNDVSTDVWIQSYDKNQTPAWNAFLDSSTYGSYHFNISALQNGDYVAVGELYNNFKTWLAAVDSAGVKKWKYIGGNTLDGIMPNIACSDAVCYLLKSLRTVDPIDVDKEIMKISVVKFTP